MHQPPRAAGAVTVIGHKLYVAGGAPQTFNISSFPVYNTLEIYDFDTGKWSFGAPMQIGRHHISGAALGGKFYVVGGRGGKDRSLDIFESYDPRPTNGKPCRSCRWASPRRGSSPPGAGSSSSVARISSTGRTAVAGSRTAPGIRPEDREVERLPT